MITRRQFAIAVRRFRRCPRARRGTAFAQAPAWPTRFVKLVVPFTPGGGIDGLGRIVGARLSEKWGQQVVVENKPGAGGNIASEYVARSAPDGYTMYITAAGLAVNQYLFPSINYDPVADFAPITLLCNFPNLLVVPKSSPVQLGRRPAGGGPQESRQGDVRDARPRQLAAHERRTVQVSRQGQSHPRALSRCLAGLYRPDRRARRLHLRGHGVGPAAGARRQAARARRHQRRAGEAGARSADHRRSGRAGLRRLVVVCVLRSRQDAARDHQEDARRYRRGAGGGRRSEPSSSSRR